MKIKFIFPVVVFSLLMLPAFSKEYRCQTDERDFVLSSLRLNINETTPAVSLDGYLTPKTKLYGIESTGMPIVTSTLLDNKICSNPDGKYICFNPTTFIKDADGIIVFLRYSDLFTLEVQLFEDEGSLNTGFASVIGRGEANGFFVDILDCEISK